MKDAGFLDEDGRKMVQNQEWGTGLVFVLPYKLRPSGRVLVWQKLHGNNSRCRVGRCPKDSLLQAALAFSPNLPLKDGPSVQPSSVPRKRYSEALSCNSLGHIRLYKPYARLSLRNLIEELVSMIKESLKDARRLFGSLGLRESIQERMQLERSDVIEEGSIQYTWSRSLCYFTSVKLL